MFFRWIFHSSKNFERLWKTLKDSERLCERTWSSIRDWDIMKSFRRKPIELPRWIKWSPTLGCIRRCVKLGVKKRNLLINRFETIKGCSLIQVISSWYGLYRDEPWWRQWFGNQPIDSPLISGRRMYLQDVSARWTCKEHPQFRPLPEKKQTNAHLTDEAYRSPITTKWSRDPIAESSGHSIYRIL